MWHASKFGICGTGRSCNHMASQRASCHLVPLHDHPQRMLQAEQAQRRLLQARRRTPISGLSSTHSNCASISASTYFSYLAQACQAMITCCTRSAIKPHLCDAEPKDTQLLVTAVCKGIACTGRVAALYRHSRSCRACSSVVFTLCVYVGKSLAGPAAACMMCNKSPMDTAWAAPCAHMACWACWQLSLQSKHACPQCAAPAQRHQLKQNFFA